MNQVSDSNFGFLQRSELWLSATFLITLVVLIIPLPTFLLDMFLACNIAAAIMLLLVTLGAKEAVGCLRVSVDAFVVDSISIVAECCYDASDSFGCRRR